MNLDTLIDQWIGGVAEKYIEKAEGEMTEECIFSLNVLQDLKSRKQELIEGIVGIIRDVPVGDKYEFFTLLEYRKNIIKELTGK